MSGLKCFVNDPVFSLYLVCLEKKWYLVEFDLLDRFYIKNYDRNHDKKYLFCILNENRLVRVIIKVIFTVIDK